MDMDPLRISVIIPAFNEESVIEATLQQFQQGVEPFEIIVVDGGSDDRTVSLVASVERVRLVSGRHRGRAAQMNEGASIATGDVLLFLHADTRLPGLWCDRIVDSIEHHKAIGGRFRIGIDDSKAIYRWIAFGSNFRSRVLGVTYGDQAIYARTDVFSRIGGYPALPLFEDSGLADLLKKEGLFDWIDLPVLTSSRRWRKGGPLRTVAKMWLMRVGYSLGIGPSALRRFYDHAR